MSITDADGATLSETAMNALTEDPPAAAVTRRVTADVYQRFSFDNAGFEQGTRLLFHAGQIVAQTAIDALFVDATVTAVTPNEGAAAGGTDVVITGTNLGGVLGVTFGGQAATLVRALSETRVSCRTPAHAEGTVNVVVTDDSGAKTLTNGFTYE
jgi:IPT/TIG domain